MINCGRQERHPRRSNPWRREPAELAGESGRPGRLPVYGGKEEGVENEAGVFTAADAEESFESPQAAR